MKPEVIVIVGPTASGKSRLAVELAQKINGEIISADSRQVYRGLDIGSGKIRPEEMNGINHYMLDVIDPKNTYTAASYAKEARVCIDRIIKNKKIPIIVGGSGFYIEALLNQNLPEVLPNPKLRQDLAGFDSASLLSKLKILDPNRAQNIDQKNNRRLIRAIEIADAIGKVPERTSPKYYYNPIFLGLKIDSQKLKDNIVARLDDRLKNNPDGLNMITEVQKLHDQGLSWNRLWELGLEYRYVSLFLQEKINKDEMRQKLITEIWRYSKRQMTWFRRNKKIVWIDEPYLDNSIKILEKI